MKALFTCILAMFALINISTAQNGPTMDFDSTTIDYGVIEQNADPYRVFKFTNNGSKPLIIKHAKGSCGCTIPQWEKEPIMPGKESEIKVRYDTKRIGKFTKRITLITNVNEEPFTLTIKGDVLAPKPQPAAVPEKAPSAFDR